MTRSLFDFSTPTAVAWHVVNDGVMGGNSRGFVSIQDGALVFTGTLVTQGGGFTSVRAECDANLEGHAGIELRVRGSGRTFELEVGDGMAYGALVLSRRAPFATDTDWTVVRIPFEALRATVRGRAVDAPPLDRSKVQRIGFFIADRQDGPFRLEVDTVAAYPTVA